MSGAKQTKQKEYEAARSCGVAYKRDTYLTN
jgi:hypothetical protein